MPLSIDPEATVWTSLITDRAKPEASRPAFECKFLSVRENQQVRRIYDQAVADVAGDDDAYAAKLLDAIMVGVIGWRNIFVPKKNRCEGCRDHDPEDEANSGCMQTSPPPDCRDPERGKTEQELHFSRENMAATLSFAEMAELCWLQITETRAAAAELFLSASASLRDSAASARTAEAESAKTNPAPPSPCSSDASAEQ
jgi:hypothetical protein